MGVFIIMMNEAQLKYYNRRVQLPKFLVHRRFYEICIARAELEDIKIIDAVRKCLNEGVMEYAKRLKEESGQGHA